MELVASLPSADTVMVSEVEVEEGDVVGVVVEALAIVVLETAVVEDGVVVVVVVDVVVDVWGRLGT